MSCIGNLGKTGLNKTPVAFNQQINAIIPSGEISPVFLFYQVQSHGFRSQLEAKATATTISIVNKGNFETIQLNIAPLAEQHRIVAKIEELFSELDQGVSSLKTAREQLKVYRQSLLKNAFEGKLTATWRAEHRDQLEPAAAFVREMKKTGKSPQVFTLSVVGFKALAAELGADATGIAISQVETTFGCVSRAER